MKKGKVSILNAVLIGGIIAFATFDHNGWRHSKDVCAYLKNRRLLTTLKSLFSNRALTERSSVIV
ncbi:hypothetical protein ACJROX_24260 [Pseudalkalibacillus sp. A8]|uniref:hypothetical protein n=1 Tax=Pseudalkalibacillus sp. A8 TaxID=3382641 RepID=UPI0038B64E83